MNPYMECIYINSFGVNESAWVIPVVLFRSSGHFAAISVSVPVEERIVSFLGVGLDGKGNESRGASKQN